LGCRRAGCAPPSFPQRRDGTIARQYGSHAHLRVVRARFAAGAGTAMGPLKLRSAMAD
jgi:hypothetical protein